VFLWLGGLCHPHDIRFGVQVGDEPQPSLNKTRPSQPCVRSEVDAASMGSGCVGFEKGMHGDLYADA
jgi:hypothetical protein